MVKRKINQYKKDLILRNRIRKTIIPGATLLVSFYFSVLFSTGAVIGYLGMDFFWKKIAQRNSLILNLDKWNIHLHHWLVGLLILTSLCLSNLIFSVSVFYIGIIGGLTFHDFHIDKKWYRIIYKNNK